ncbi:MAG: FAD-dependent oxidoreductase, partial [Bdellovibrionota bacterium]
TGPDNLYPKGGMHVFVERMKEQIEKKVRIYLKEGLKALKESGDEYELTTTAENQFVASKLVLAIPKLALNKVSGDLVEAIRKAPQYEAILPVPIVVINQLWDEAWWEKAHDPKNSEPSGQVWRAWSNDSCVNHVEIPQEAYLAEREQRPTRSVYSDDPVCNQKWATLFKEKGVAGIEAEVLEGLAKVFGHPKHPIKIPKPRATTLHYWPAGWYYAHKSSKFSNAEIAEWSRQPLKAHPNLMLVGEGYWLDRPGWSEGAYFSADALIESKKLK